MAETRYPGTFRSGREDKKFAFASNIYDETQGKLQEDINSEVKEKLDDVKDTLQSESTTTPLSANQGKVLKELLDAKVIEAGDVPMDSEPTEGNTDHVVTSDGLAKLKKSLNDDTSKLRDDIFGTEYLNITKEITEVPTTTYNYFNGTLDTPIPANSTVILSIIDNNEEAVINGYFYYRLNGGDAIANSGFSTTFVTTEIITSMRIYQMVNRFTGKFGNINVIVKSSSYSEEIDVKIEELQNITSSTKTQCDTNTTNISNIKTELNNTILDSTTNVNEPLTWDDDYKNIFIAVNASYKLKINHLDTTNPPEETVGKMGLGIIYTENDSTVYIKQLAVGVDFSGTEYDFVIPETATTALVKVRNNGEANVDLDIIKTCKLSQLQIDLENKIKSKVDTLQGEVDTLQEEVDTLEESINTNTKSIEELKTDIDGKDERLSEKGTLFITSTELYNTNEENISYLATVKEGDIINIIPNSTISYAKCVFTTVKPIKGNTENNRITDSPTSFSEAIENYIMPSDGFVFVLDYYYKTEETVHNIKTFTINGEDAITDIHIKGIKDNLEIITEEINTINYNIDNISTKVNTLNTDIYDKQEKNITELFNAFYNSSTVYLSRPNTIAYIIPISNGDVVDIIGGATTEMSNYAKCTFTKNKPILGGTSDEAVLIDGAITYYNIAINVHTTYTATEDCYLYVLDYYDNAPTPGHQLGDVTINGNSAFGYIVEGIKSKVASIITELEDLTNRVKTLEDTFITDTNLSLTSENPVQNKVITNKLFDNKLISDISMLSIESEWWYKDNYFNNLYSASENTVLEAFKTYFKARQSDNIYQIAVISDTHGTGAYSYRTNRLTSFSSCYRSIALFNKIVEECNAGIHGGDISCDYGTSKLRYLSYASALLRNFRFSKPFFITKGNHDENNNNYSEINPLTLDWSTNDYYIRVFNDFYKVPEVSWKDTQLYTYDSDTETYNEISFNDCVWEGTNKGTYYADSLRSPGSKIIVAQYWNGDPLYTVEHNLVTDTEFKNTIQRWLYPSNAEYGNGAYYYYDDETYKIRIVVANSFPINDDGSAGDIAEYTWLGEKAFNFSTKTTPTEWQVLILRHTQSTSITNLSAAINALRLGTSWTYNDITYDFGIINGGPISVIAHIHGHEHGSVVANSQGYMDIGESAAFVSSGSIGDPRAYGLSVWSIDLTNKIIYEDRIATKSSDGVDFITQIYDYGNNKIKLKIGDSIKFAESGLSRTVTVSSSDETIATCGSDPTKMTVTGVSAGDVEISVIGSNGTTNICYLSVIE